MGFEFYKVINTWEKLYLTVKGKPTPVMVCWIQKSLIHKVQFQIAKALQKFGWFWWLFFLFNTQFAAWGITFDVRNVLIFKNLNLL